MREILWFLLRLGFGGVFLWSGVAKIKDPLGFTDAVRNFELVNDPIAPGLALLIPCVEIVAALATMSGRAWRGGVAVILASLVVFTGALCIAWVRGLDITCGCFGGSGEVNYPVRVGTNLVLGVIGGLLLKNRDRY